MTARDTFLVGNAGARERRCKHCKRLLRKRVRIDAETCSKSCRQKFSRRHLKVSNVSRKAAARVLSVSARRRALDGVSID